MKTLLLLLLCCRPFFLAGPCFEFLLNKGIAELEAKNYDKALLKWNGAMECPDAGPGERALLRQWIAIANERKTGPVRAGRREFVENFEAKTDKTAGQVNWSRQFVEAEGMAVIDRVKYANEAQARAVALRGAEVVAYANLLEITKGVRVQRSTTVRDLMTESDVVRTEVEGIVRGARREGEPREKDGLMYVRVRMPLYELSPLAAQTAAAAAAAPNPLYPRPEPAGWLLPPVPGETRALLLRFDGPFNPALAPVIADDQGNTLFDLSVLIAPPGSAPAVPPDWNGPKLEARAVQRADGTLHLPDNAGEVLAYLRERAETGGKMQPVVAFLSQ